MRIFVIPVSILMMPLVSHSADIAGLGDIKIGSTKQQIKVQMKSKHTSVLPTGMDFGTYDGGDFDAFENVFITPKIKLNEVYLYYHQDYLHLISAQDEHDSDGMRELVSGFQFKYGNPTYEVTKKEIKNPCDESQTVEEHTLNKIFNKGSKIEAVYVETVYSIPSTTTAVSVCGKYFNAGFSVYDVETLKKATEEQKFQDDFDEQSELNDRFEGL